MSDPNSQASQYVAARAKKPMSDEFWMSLGFLCGAAFGSFAKEQKPMVARHVDRVMLELLDHFPEEMFALKKYVERPK